MRHSSEQIADTYTTDPLESLSMDIVGPVRVPGTGGIRYALIFLDKRSRYMFLGFTKDITASDMEPTIRNVRLQIHNGTRWTWKNLYMDAASQHRSSEFTDLLQGLDILPFVHPGRQLSDVKSDPSSEQHQPISEHLIFPGPPGPPGPPGHVNANTPSLNTISWKPSA